MPKHQVPGHSRQLPSLTGRPGLLGLEDVVHDRPGLGSVSSRPGVTLLVFSFGRPVL